MFERKWRSYSKRYGMTCIGSFNSKVLFMALIINSSPVVSSSSIVCLCESSFAASPESL